MFQNINLDILGATLLSLLLTLAIIPSLIKIAEIKHLFDSTDERKSHTGSVPNLAGIAIFGSFMISYCLFGYFGEKEIKYLLSALCLVFMVGAKDDIEDLTPYKKFGLQFAAAMIVVIIGDLRLTSFYGIFGITTLPYIFSILFSVITVVFIINAFNLIDGVNWLAAGVTLVASITFGSWFYIHGYYDYAIMSACIVGSIVAFMKFNRTPAKIFLGDSGSLSLGLLTAVMAIEFIELADKDAYSSINMPFYISSGPAMAISILIIPIFDTLKVFIVRIIHGKSPFYPDRSHHHHKLLDMGFTHEQTSMILVAVNIFFITATYYLQFLRSYVLIGLIFFTASLLSFILFKSNFKLSKNKFLEKPIL